MDLKTGCQNVTSPSKQKYWLLLKIIKLALSKHYNPNKQADVKRLVERMDLVYTEGDNPENYLPEVD